MEKDKYPPIGKELMTVKTFCDLYEIGPTRFYALVSKKLLRVVKEGRRNMIRREDAEAWKNSLETKE